MRLSDLCQAVSGAELRGCDVDVAAVAYHTKDVVPGALFVALRGLRTDGHFFLKEAADKGAVAAVVSTPNCEGWPVDRPLVVVPDTRKALAMMAVRFYGDPSSRLKVYGVTGTNGKTTTAFLIQSIMSAAGVKTGVIGTLGCRIGNRVIETDRTTPESLDLQRILSDLLRVGAEAVAVEVSSHALALGRTLGCRFAGAVFTNLTQDHLDFHPSIEEYFRAKSLLFTEHAAPAGENFVSAICVDSDWGRRLSKAALGRVVTFGLSPEAEVRAENADYSTNGTSFRLVSPYGSRDVRLKLI
ncbi:MAG: Mur ligase family protein, partial [Armatimonadota bacterium]